MGILVGLASVFYTALIHLDTRVVFVHLIPLFIFE